VLLFFNQPVCCFFPFIFCIYLRVQIASSSETRSILRDLRIAAGFRPDAKTAAEAEAEAAAASTDSTTDGSPAAATEVPAEHQHLSSVLSASYAEAEAELQRALDSVRTFDANMRTETGDAARERAGDARLTQSNAEGELQTLRDEARADFGPGDSFYPLKGKCFDLRVNQYTYTICPFQNARQDSTSLGNFEGWAVNSAGGKNYGEMRFTNGLYCWNGPARSLRVLFECGAEDAVVSFDEPEKCTYTARFQTPAVCDDKHARELKLELEETEGAKGAEVYEQKTDL
jgi:hypothetical protein